MPTPLNDLVSMLLSPQVKTREDLLPWEQMIGLHPMQKGMNAAVNGPLGQLAQMVQAQKQQEDAKKQWYGQQQPASPTPMPDRVNPMDVQGIVGELLKSLNLGSMRKGRGVLSGVADGGG